MYLVAHPHGAELGGNRNRIELRSISHISFAYVGHPVYGFHCCFSRAYALNNDFVSRSVDPRPCRNT